MDSSRGFSLIEVLVTLLLTSVGLLGMFALQSKSIEYSQEAVQRQLAIRFANELLEIMRRHRAEFFMQQSGLSHAYTQLQAASVLYNADGSLRLNAEQCPSNSVPQSALEEGHCWLKALQMQLPGSAETEVLRAFKLCPSFKAGRCAGSGYQGASLELQLAWRGAASECGEAAEDGICTYRTRIEL